MPTIDAFKKPVLNVNHLACGYDGRAVVTDVTFSVQAGEVLTILGPNGVGKTTLFKTLLGFMPALSGEMRLCGEDVSDWTRKRFASVVAYIPQQHNPAFPFSVSEFVLMGRTPSIGTLSTPDAHDAQIAHEALVRLGIESLSERDYTSLSGGERQMVLIARALAQQPQVLVMDEPCASLDYGNQVRLLEQVIDLTHDGLSVVMTTHDPNHAFMVGGKVFCMGRSEHFTYGAVSDVLNERTLQDLYGVEVGIAPATASDGTVVNGCIPFLGSAARREAGRGSVVEATSVSPNVHTAIATDKSNAVDKSNATDKPNDRRFRKAL